MGMLTDVRASLTRHDQMTRETRAAVAALEEEAVETLAWVRAAAFAVVFVAAFAVTTYVLAQIKAESA